MYLTYKISKENYRIILYLKLIFKNREFITILRTKLFPNC